MEKNIAQISGMLEDVAQILIGTLYDLSADDGGNNDIEIPDEWTLRRFMEAGFIRNINENEMEQIKYPYMVSQHVVYTDELALNMDNLSASYQATKARNSVIKINNTLSTVDALCVRDKEWYLFEFKNGNWNVRDIEDKINGTMRLLDDLERLDKNAVITTNRDGRIVEAAELNLKAKLENELGFRADSAFYKSRMSLYVVYTDNVRKAKEFNELCAMRKQYADMAAVFERNKVFEKKMVSPGVEMGDRQINMFAAYLLKATTENQYYPVYRRLQKLYDRCKKMDMPSNQKYFKLLKEFPVFISELPRLLSQKSRSYFVENMLPGQFLTQLAVCSIEHLQEEDIPECEPDEYDIVKGLLDTVIQKDYSKYVGECENLVQLFGEALSEEQGALKAVSDAEFVYEIKTLLTTDFCEALGRILLIQRVSNIRDCYRLDRRQQKMLLENILHMDAEKAESALDIVNHDMKLFCQFIALKSYFAKRYTCFWNPDKDDYMHICRQIYYLKELFKKEQLSGESHQKTRTYGCFGALLQLLKEGEEPIGFQKKLEERVRQIEQNILAGRSRAEIQPLEMAVQGVIGSKNIDLQQLRYSFEGAVFKKVAGCRGEDFTRI